MNSQWRGFAFDKHSRRQGFSFGNEALAKSGREESRKRNQRFGGDAFPQSELATRPHQQSGSEDDKGAKIQTLYVVFGAALDLAVKDHRVRVCAHGGNEREGLCIVRLRDSGELNYGIVIDFGKILFASGRLNGRTEAAEVDVAPNLRFDRGNSARSATKTSVSFGFETLIGLRETEMTSVIVESARSCWTRNEPVRPVLPMSVAIII